MGGSDNDAVPDRLSDLDPISAASEPSVADLCGELAGPAAELFAEAQDALARAQADRELYELAVEHGGAGPVWELLVEALTSYALGVLEPWIYTREIYSVLARKFNGVQLGTAAAREWLASDRVYREEVIRQTTARAIEKVANAIRAGGVGGWDPRKGLSLRSYFLNGCLAEFLSVFEREQRWWNTHHGGPHDESDVDELAESGRGVLWGSGLGRDPADIVVNRQLLFDNLATLPVDDRTLLWAHAVGYSHAEIAHLFAGATPKAIERRLYRLRKYFIVRSR